MWPRFPNPLESVKQEVIAFKQRNKLEFSGYLDLLAHDTQKQLQVLHLENNVPFDIQFTTHDSRSVVKQAKSIIDQIPIELQNYLDYHRLQRKLVNCPRECWKLCIQDDRGTWEWWLSNSEQNPDNMLYVDSLVDFYEEKKHILVLHFDRLTFIITRFPSMETCYPPPSPSQRRAGETLQPPTHIIITIKSSDDDTKTIVCMYHRNTIEKIINTFLRFYIGQLDPEDVQLIISQTNASKTVTEILLLLYKGDIVDAVIAYTSKDKLIWESICECKALIEKLQRAEMISGT